MGDEAQTAASPDIRVGDKPGELLVFDHGFVRLDDSMADDLSVVNAARVSFAVRKEAMDERDTGLIRFLMRNAHGTPFEHNSFKFHIRAPIFVAREWFRHRIGCLTGDTRVTLVDAASARPFTTAISKLVPFFVDPASFPAAFARDKEQRLRVLNEHTNEFEIGRLGGVIDTGVQAVYRVSLADGKHLTATDGHRVLTDRGWSALRDAVGLVGVGREAETTRPCRLMTNGLVEGRRLTVRAGPVEVAAVSYAGLRRTYDLTVEGEWHNLVANGVVVHNSFNEESARYHKLADDFYMPSPTAVRTQVGKPGAYSFEPAADAVAAETIDTFERVYKQLYEEYLTLVDKGVAKELARALLPFGIYTQFYWTINARSLMNFLSLRNADAAQYEIRTYAQAVEQLFADRMPETYACFLEFGRRVP